MINVNGSDIEWKENLTITELFKICKFNFKVLVVQVNKKIVKKEDFATTIIQDNAEVRIHHVISGG